MARLETLQKLPNRAARIVTRSNFDSSAKPLIHNLKWPTISLSLSLYVPCSLRTLATIDFHNSLSFAVLRIFSFLTFDCSLSSTCSVIHLLRLSRYVNRCFPLLLFPFTRPVSINSSKPSFLITCPKNSICHFLIVFIIFRSVPALRETSSLAT